MSKRYGRQQKRKARAQLEALESKYTEIEKKLLQTRDAARRDHQIVEDTAEVLGHYFVTLDPPEFKLLQEHWSNDWPDDWFISRFEPGLHSPHSAAQDYSELICRKIRASPMSLEPVFDRLRRYVHIKLTYNNQLVTYAFPLESMRDLPHDYLVRKLSNQLAFLLVDKLRK